MNRKGSCVRIGLFVLFTVILGLLTTAVQVQAEESAATDESKPHSRIVIYPVLWQAPIYGANVELPAVPDVPGGGGEGSSNSTDYSWNSALLAGFTIERDAWFFDFEGEYAGLSADRQNPLLKVNADIYYFKAMGGWRFYNDFAVSGGVKRLGINLHATLGNNLEAHAKPGLWDPMIGIDWRRFVSHKIHLNAAFEGGGFGVGTDVDLSSHIDVDWEFLPHVVLNTGYGFLYFKASVAKVAVGPLERELIMKQTLHGPRVGIGIQF